MFFKYPSIDNLHNLKRDIKKYYGGFTDVDIPVSGTVKIHGTNAGVTLSIDGSVFYQSRNRNITTESDNAGFALFASEREYEFDRAAGCIGFNDFEYITIYGEWCGGNIQKNVGVSGMDKAFVVFAAKRTSIIDESDRDSDVCEWVDLSSIEFDNDLNIYNIEEFCSYNSTLNISSEESIDNFYNITKDVEDECPVAKKLNPDGNMVGEGVVWFGFMGDKAFRFKVKGDKHSRGSGSKKVSVDAKLTPEQSESINAFYELALTDDRLLQGIEVLKEKGMDDSMRNLGSYLKWVSHDVMKECRHEISDLDTKYGIKWGSLSKRLTNVAKGFYINR